MTLESDLYAPVKALLEGQGYTVKGEVRGCDVVGVRGDEPPVIIELKRIFGLSLVLQGVDAVLDARGDCQMARTLMTRLVRRALLVVLVVVSASVGSAGEVVNA